MSFGSFLLGGLGEGQSRKLLLSVFGSTLSVADRKTYVEVRDASLLGSLGAKTPYKQLRLLFKD